MMILNGLKSSFCLFFLLKIDQLVIIHKNKLVNLYVLNIAFTCTQ